jgi:hypothetical protein
VSAPDSRLHTYGESAQQHRATIAILDYGSQYTQLIARRVRESHGYCEIAFDREGMPRAFDFEGQPSESVTLIENGVARAVVYDSSTAHRAGVRSTACAVSAAIFRCCCRASSSVCRRRPRACRRYVSLRTFTGTTRC